MKQIRAKIYDFRVIVYAILIFAVCISIGELEARRRYAKSEKLLDPMEQVGYNPAVRQFSKLEDYISKFGMPECIILGNSLVKVGIDPEIFAREFSTASGQHIRCYNFGISGSTMSSVATNALILSRRYQPQYLVIGIHSNQFMVSDPDEEDQYNKQAWIRYVSGEFVLRGWLLENSMLYRRIDLLMPKFFPNYVKSVPLDDSSEEGIRPIVHRITINDAYSPIPGYRDNSPLFVDYVPRDYTDRPIDQDDMHELQRLLDYNQSSASKILMLEMPTTTQALDLAYPISTVKDLLHSYNLPFLETNQLPYLGDYAFTDVIHMHVSGSYIFSKWLGRYLGQAIKEGALERINDAIWVPEFQTWTADYVDTLGLSQDDYAEYLDFAKTTEIIDQEAIIFDPQANAIEQSLAQSLLGFEVEWRHDAKIERLPAIYELMYLIGRTIYRDDPKLNSVDLEQWQETLNPSLLRDAGIDYIFCVIEKANPDRQNCPTSVYNSANYSLVGTWEFESLYEDYQLFQILPDAK